MMTKNEWRKKRIDVFEAMDFAIGNLEGRIDVNNQKGHALFLKDYLGELYEDYALVIGKDQLYVCLIDQNYKDIERKIVCSLDWELDDDEISRVMAMVLMNYDEGKFPSRWEHSED